MAISVVVVLRPCWEVSPVPPGIWARWAGKLGGRPSAGPPSPRRQDRAGSGHSGQVPGWELSRLRLGHGGSCGSHGDRPTATRPSVVIEVSCALHAFPCCSVLGSLCWHHGAGGALFPQPLPVSGPPVPLWAVRALIDFFKFQAYNSKTALHNRVCFWRLLCLFKLCFVSPPPFSMPRKFLLEAGRNVDEQREPRQTGLWRELLRVRRRVGPRSLVAAAAGAATGWNSQVLAFVSPLWVSLETPFKIELEPCSVVTSFVI